MKVIAVVVTYNRLPLLQRNIACLKQNAPVSRIIVVNNGSTDGTAQWLDSQTGLDVVHQENVGGAGGFSAGIDRACRHNPDWIWCMDDDVFPRNTCMAQLLRHAHRPEVGILAPRRLMEGKVFCNDFLDYNLTNPFASTYRGKLTKRPVDQPTYVAGTAFEGLCIRREVVERIGLPNRELFIFCDDTDYCLRTVLAGWRILYVPDALIDKHRFFSADSWAERNKKKKWKRFYQIRNSAYLNHHYGRNWGVKHLRSFIGLTGYVLTALLTIPFSDAYRLTDIPRMWQAYQDGIHERLGIMHAPGPQTHGPAHDA